MSEFSAIQTLTLREKQCSKFTFVYIFILNALEICNVHISITYLKGVYAKLLNILYCKVMRNGY